MKKIFSIVLTIISVGISAQANSEDCAKKVAIWGQAKMSEGMQFQKIQSGKDIMKSLELPTGGTQADRLYVEGVLVGIFPFIPNNKYRIEDAEAALLKQQVQNLEMYEQLLKECFSGR
jgi:hypothetical protein